MERYLVFIPRAGNATQIFVRESHDKDCILKTAKIYSRGFIYINPQTHKVGVSICFKGKKQKHREVKTLVRGHTARLQRSENLSPDHAIKCGD